MSKIYNKLHSVSRLRKAWSVIYSNGINSKSSQTRNEIKEFALTSERSLKRISDQLRDKRFVFSPAHGIAASKKNNTKKKRPIVISPIESRIVQRAILDVIQEIDFFKEKLNSRFNFGGVPEVGVPEAVIKAYKTSLIKPYFIRTDIKAFFDNIPREDAIKYISSKIDDDEFNQILTQATNTELDNLKELGRDGELFPLEGKGVAQGSCLSPILCNLLLDEFDNLMNKRNIVCIRYIDDFILFAPKEASAFRAFESAKKYLNKMNLEIYDPLTSPEKAENGMAGSGFEFLGCSIRPDRIRPAKKSVTNLKEKIKLIFSKVINAPFDLQKVESNKLTYKDALYEAGNTIRGWGNTYSFCTDDTLMKNLDIWITDLFKTFNSNYKRKLKRLTSNEQRRMFGIFLLENCKRDMDVRDLVKKQLTP